LTGDLRAALEMLRPHLVHDAPPAETVRAFHAAVCVWMDTIERDELRRRRFEERVAVKFREFEQLLEDRTERNLRIRLMRVAIEELQAQLNETRVRVGLPERVFEVDVRRRLDTLPHLQQARENREANRG